LVINIVIDSDMLGPKPLMDLVPQALEVARIRLTAGVMEPEVPSRATVGRDSGADYSADAWIAYRYVTRGMAPRADDPVTVEPNAQEPVPSTGQVGGDPAVSIEKGGTN
jgi:hypothetical protein